MTRLAALWPLPALAALLALAWALAHALPAPQAPTPPPAPQAPRDPCAALLARLPADPAPAALAAEVLADLHVTLRREDVAAWRALVAGGMPPPQALRTVVDYRRASGATP